MAEDKKKEVAPKKKEAAPKTVKPKADPVEQVPVPHMINWRQIASEVEQIIEERGWTQIKHRKNPRFLHGVVMRKIIGPLVKNLPKE